jgi:uncharacterized protein with beta-barrel porin domain
MNKIYRLIWSKSRKCIVAVSEITKGHGKGSSKSNTVGSVLASTLLALSATAGLASLPIDSAVAAVNIDITGSSDQITLTGGDSLTVQTSGTVTGTVSGTAGGTYGVIVNAGASANFIDNQGTITGATGIYLTSSTLSGGITNSGLISGSGSGIYLTASTLSGGINNSGTISAASYSGIYLASSTLSGGITNSGLISGTVGINLDSASTLSGGINNSGLISGTVGINLDSASTLSGGINNSGTISGAAKGIAIYRSALSGGITNSGLISGDAAGISLFRSTLSNGINNSGTIFSGSTSGAAAIYFEQSTLSGGITNSGLISGTLGIYLRQSTLSGGINNSGTISGDAKGIYLRQSTLSGGINNSGLISGDYGIYLTSSTLTDGITNSGSIFGSSTGIYIYQSTLSGGINNSGTISAAKYTGIYLSNSSLSGGIQNSGSISGRNTGIVLRSGTLTDGITNSGTISGGKYGIFLDSSTLSGGINNSGLISSFSSGAIKLVSSTLSGGITNSGSIFNDGSYGIYLSNSKLSGGINNSGSISSSYGISLIGSTLTDGINNSGTIFGVATGATSGAGINLSSSTLSGGITNSGLISGANGIAVNANNSSTLDIHNQVSGTLMGAIVGAGTSVLNVTNSGLFALHNAADTPVNSTFTGSYYQSQSGTLQLGLKGTGGSGTSSGNYSQLIVAGTAQIEGTSNLRVLSSSASPVANGATLAGVILASTLTGGDSFSVQDNLAQFDFISNKVGDQINLVASTVTGCGAAVSGAEVGTCSVAIDQANLSIVSGASITNTLTGGNAIDVLFGSYAGGITNAGTLTAAQNGISFNSGTTFVGNITNTGLISAGAVGISVINSIVDGTINNAGTISGGVAGILIDPSTVARITNSGLISGGTNGLKISLSTVTGGITNSGVISGGNVGLMVSSSAIVGGITNSGTISGGTGATDAGIYLTTGASLDNLVNTGLIGGTYSIWNAGTIGSINNQGTISNLVNGQGGSATALNYTGILPGTYSILISSTTNYGQISFSSVSGTMTFGGIATGSTLVDNHTYSGVLSGMSSGSLSGSGSSRSGSYGAYSWTLFQDAGDLTLWDLFIGTSISPVSVNYVSNVSAANNPAALGAAYALTNIATNSVAGMAGVVTALNGLSGSAQSNAISQTLPVLTGAGSQATAVAQRGLAQAVQGRQDMLAGGATGSDYFAVNNFWIKGFGSWANQNQVNNVAGYKINTGGLALGGEHALSPRASIGAVFALSNSYANSNNSAAPSSLSMNTYQVGVYGHYKLDPSLHWTYQANVGLSNQKEARNLSDFANVTGVSGTMARANYNAYTQYLGTGLQDRFTVTEKTRLIPSVSVDYAAVQSNSYQENGAGALNLNINGQNYQELYTSAGARIEHDIAPTVKVSGNVGAGYNWLNSQVQTTAAYQGGGGSFTTNGLSLSPWLYNAGLGIAGTMYKNVELSLRYDYQFSSSGYTNQIVGGRLKIGF